MIKINNLADLLKKVNSKQYTDEQITEVINSHLKRIHKNEISLSLNIPLSTVNRWITIYDNNFKNLNIKEGLKKSLFLFAETQNPDSELVDAATNLQRKNQRLMDSNRIERKAFREHARHINAIEDLTKALIETFTLRKFHVETVKHPEISGAPIGIIQLSDLHLNQVICDQVGNSFDLDIASRRLFKHVFKSSIVFKSNGVKEVVLAMTGDLVKNIQHLSEISSNSMSRANATFVAVELISGIIKGLNDSGFNVTVASVVGNESRMSDHIHETNFLVSDSFDLMIHNLISLLFKDKPGVKVVPMTNPLECLLNLNGQNILLIHGHSHGRFASTATLEKSTDAITSRYASQGIIVNYVLLGHIHSAYISDKFARSGGLPGNDEYATRKLGLFGRASQNSFLVHTDGAIDGFKHDLQDVSEYKNGYSFDEVAERLSIQNVVRPGGLGGNVNLTINGSTFASYTV